MPTTALLVEIVIVGFSFFLSVLPVVALVFQTDPQAVLIFYANIPLQFQLAAAYAAGVIWNRICDQLFHSLDQQIIRSKFPSRETYQAARIKAILQGESIRDYIGNFRSLIRVCRASSILLIIYAIAIPVYIFNPNLVINLGIVNKVAIVFFELILLATSIYAWFRLERGYVSAIYDAYTAIRDNSENKKLTTISKEHSKKDDKK